MGTRFLQILTMQRLYKEAPMLPCVLLTLYLYRKSIHGNVGVLVCGYFEELVCISNAHGSEKLASCTAAFDCHSDIIVLDFAIV